MEIVKKQTQDILELQIQGRLDAYWADHLSASIEDSMRLGFHRLQLNLAKVDYLSSAGIRVLLKFYKQLKGIEGSLTVTQPSKTALAILELAGLQDILLSPEAQAAPPVQGREPRRIQKNSASYLVFDIDAGATLQCALVGDPTKLETGNLAESDSQGHAFPDSTFGVGLGAFGTDFADCKGRYGEFVALAGVAACLPTDGTTVPDYVVSEGALVPELEVLYALTGQGSYAKLVRFEAKPEPPGVVSLAEVVDIALEAAGAETVGIAMVVEAAGLVGAAIKQPPVQRTASDSILSFPGIRDWLSFTAERAFDRTVCVIVGMAARQPSPVLAPILRPVGPDTQAVGHFHAAVFPYHPVQRGELDLHNTVNALFTNESIRGMLHLLPDTREIDGVGQSEFLRGACWVGPITAIKTSRP